MIYLSQIRPLIILKNNIPDVKSEGVCPRERCYVLVSMLHGNNYWVGSLSP